MEQNAYKSICEQVHAAFPAVSQKQPGLISPLTLAYIGDTVYDLFVRLYAISATDYTVNALHKLSSSMVCAKAQSKAAKLIGDKLTEEEEYIFKRGRNANSTPPKGCDKSDYRMATGLEALLGYLFLSGNDQRLCELMEVILGNTEK